MTTHAFTPAPWSYRPSSDGCDETWEITAPFAESPLARVPYWPDEDGLVSAEAEANARLMASAPKLLDACKSAEQCIADFLDVYTRNVSMLVLDEAAKSLKHDALKMIRAAIATAA